CRTSPRRRLLSEGCEPQNATRGVLGGLQHQCVAGTKGGRDLERREDDRRLPRYDGANRPDRFPPRVAEHMFAQRNRLALEFAGKATEIAQNIRRALGLGPGLRADRIASLLGDDPGEFLHLRLDRIRNLLQHTAALSRNNAAPACEGLARSLRGPADVVGTAARNAGNDLAVPRRVNPYFISAGDSYPPS